MEWWWGAWHLLVALATTPFSVRRIETLEFVTENRITRVTKDPRTGRIYLGAVNALYQLTSDLKPEHQVQTGPVWEDWKCWPNVAQYCETAPNLNNHNKLLVVLNETSLLACGTAYYGSCVIRNLSNVEDLLFSSDNIGENFYVATQHENLSVVGILTYLMIEQKNVTVITVGRGVKAFNTNKFISIHNVDPNNGETAFMNMMDASPVERVAIHKMHRFIYGFKDSGYLYLLAVRSHNGDVTRNSTHLIRMCENDVNVFSFIDVQLNCTVYNVAQAAFVGPPGEALARDMTAAGHFGHVSTSDKVLYVTFQDEGDPSKSALCIYPLREINDRMVQLVKACYNDNGIINNASAVHSYKTYFGSDCIVHKNKMIFDTFKCGADFLPSPLSGRPKFAVAAAPSLVYQAKISAVAVTVDTGNTVAFFGTENGEVLKAHVGARAEVYTRLPGNRKEGRVNDNLIFDNRERHLYVATNNKISKIPVQNCHVKTDCQSCVSVRDPYCGWCVLEGICSTKSDCRQSSEPNGWLWSPNQLCVRVQVIDPPSMSIRKTQQVEMTIVRLPRLQPYDRLLCKIGSHSSEGVLSEARKLTCSLPDPVEIPNTPTHQDFVEVPIKVLLNGTIDVTSATYRYYNCTATSRLHPNAPCRSCVTSEWGCQWNILTHACGDDDPAIEGAHIIKPDQSDLCPLLHSAEPLLVPVGYRTPVTFWGRNMDIYAGRRFIVSDGVTMQPEAATEEPGSKFSFRTRELISWKQLEVNVSFYVADSDSKRWIDSDLTVVLYNCSMGSADCSLCKSTDKKYQCIWCESRQACVFEKLCPSPLPVQCPSPTVSDIVPRYGPLTGHILVTVTGSDMGVMNENVSKITVAGIDCVHKRDRFTVSNRLVCEVGPLSSLGGGSPEATHSGVVELEMADGKKGRSSVRFTYRDPRPTHIQPDAGPFAGGTVISIMGHDLDTGSKEDISVMVGSVTCHVLSLSDRITCKTGKYKYTIDKTASVTVKYGEYTTKHIPSAFTYTENPKITNYFPKDSFLCGGRKITVLGTRFDMIQQAFMKVQASSYDLSLRTEPMEFMQKAVSKNDTVLQFLSPGVNCSVDSYILNTTLHLDNFVEDLTNFNYQPDPTFSYFNATKITEAGVIVVTGRGFSRAMTFREAEAFVGGVPCHITILQDDKMMLDAPSSRHKAKAKGYQTDATKDQLDLVVKFGFCDWTVGRVYFAKKEELPLYIIVPAVVVPMLLLIAVSVYCYRRKSQQAEREYEKVRHQLENLEETVRDRCKKEFTDLMIEMEDQYSDHNEARIPFLDYKTYTDRNFFLPSQSRDDDAMITGKIEIPESRRAIVEQALTQFSNLLNSKTFLINFIHTLESRPDFNARARSYFASLLTVALHGKLEYYTNITRTLLLELMDEHVQSKNPKLMLRRSETVVERMLCNWMSICLYQFLRDAAGEPLYKLFQALKHQVEKGPVDVKMKKAKYTLNDTGLLGDDVEYSALTVQVLVHGEGPDVTPVKVLTCDTITQVTEKVIDQVFRNLPFSQRPKAENMALEWRPGSAGQVLSDIDLTSQRDGQWRKLNTLAHYNVRDNATLVLSKILHARTFHQHQDNSEEKNSLLEEDNTFHLVRLADDVEDVKSKRSNVKDKATTKAITEIYLTRLLSVKGTLQKFVDDFFRSVLCCRAVPPAVKYFFDFLDEQALRHDNVDEETLHIWKTNSLPLRFWVNILRNPHFIFDVHVSDVVDGSLHVIAQTLMDACTKTEHKLSRDSPSNKLLYAKEISTYKKMVDNYYKGIRQMVPVSDQDMNTHLAELSREHTDQLNTQVALYQLYQYASKYYDVIIQSLDDDPAAQNKQLTLRLQQIAAALENKVTDL